MARKPIRKHSSKDTKVTGLICPHCKGDHFKVIADLTIGGVPYVYITKETIAIVAQRRDRHGARHNEGKARIEASCDI